MNDVLIVGTSGWNKAVVNTFTTLWECKIGGVLGEVDNGIEGVVSMLSLLGIAMEYKHEKGSLILHSHQKKYFLSKLHKRNLLVGQAIAYGEGRPSATNGQECK